MKIIVQKFGGTSTGSPHSRRLIYDHIQRACNNGYKVVVVVSAMGRFDDPYATDTLFSLVNKANLTPEERDRLASVGETISALVVKSEFMNLNINVTTLNNDELGIITDDHFTNAKIIRTDGSLIMERLKKYDVVICPGFQGHNEQHVITTLGRGASDLSAIALAIAVQAESVEIYSDVNGVFTADPRIVSNAFRLPYISHKAMLQLSLEGAKVLNPRCVEMAAAHQVMIHARSSFSNGWGTLVSDQYEHLCQYPISGVTGSFNNAMIRLHNYDNDPRKNKMIQASFNESGIVVLSSHYQKSLDALGNLTLLVNEEDVAKAAQILQDMKEMLEITRMVVRGDIGRVSIVGDDLAKNKHIYEEAVYTLVAAGINIIHSGREDLCARFYIDKKDVKEAQCLLHDYFFSKTKEEFKNEKI